MAAPAELRVLEPFPPLLCPTDALLSRPQLLELLGEDSEKQTEPQTALLFTPAQRQGHGGRGVLLRVTGTELRPAGHTDGVLQLWVSPLLLRLLPDLRPGSVRPLEPSPGSVRPLDPVVLDRVVLGVSSGLCSQDLSAVCERLQQSGDLILIQRGLALFLTHWPQPFLVLDCSPVSKGRVTAQTSVLITDCCDWPDPLQILPPAPPRPIRLYVSDFAVLSDGLKGRSFLHQPRLLEAGLTGILQALECRVVVTVTPLSDVDSSSLLLPPPLLLRLGLFNGQWVRVSSGGGARERLVTVMTTDTLTSEGQEEEAGLISTTMWFNLSEGEVVPNDATSLRIKRWSPEAESCRSQTFSISASPPFASEIHLQPVHSPHYCSTEKYDQVLTQYFTTPRLLCEGDLLSVPVLNRPDLIQNSDHIQRSPVVHFRVQSVSCKDESSAGCLVDRDHTSLFMGMAVNSPAPSVCVGGASVWTGLSPPGLSFTVEHLCELIRPHRTHSRLGRCSLLLLGPEGGGKQTAIRAAAQRLHLHLMKVDCVSLCADSFAASETKMALVFDRASEVCPCVLVLRNLHLLLRGDHHRLQTALRQLLAVTHSDVVVVATVPRASDLVAAVVPLFLHQVSLLSPDQDQRKVMLQGLTQDLDLGLDVNLERLAKLTAGLLFGDLAALVSEASREATHRLLQICVGRSEAELLLSGVFLLKQDFSSALKTIQEAQAQTVGAPKIPCVRWQDVGGLHQVKAQILDTVSLPLTRPELLSLGLDRTGILLYGPPGTGKTLLAKAVATECSMNFLSVKGPELINMYVGQSEENVRTVFTRARAAAPCVVFFDELDSLAPSRGRSGDSGGVMDRVVSQLLSELDCLSSCGVFVIGATNRPDLIDQSLLRPGRFDKLVYVGVNEDRASQLQVLQAILQKFDLEPSLDLAAILDRCPGHMTGADLYALCCDAMTSAIKRKIGLIALKLDTEDSPLTLCLDDFIAAVKDFKPSVSEKELLRYKNLQTSFNKDLV